MKKYLLALVLCVGCQKGVEKRYVKPTSYKVICLDTFGQPIPGMVFTNLFMGGFGDFYDSRGKILTLNTKYVGIPE